MPQPQRQFGSLHRGRRGVRAEGILPAVAFGGHAVPGLRFRGGIPRGSGSAAGGLRPAGHHDAATDRAGTPEGTKAAKFNLPVIAISARDDAETSMLARQLGARFFFRKPVDDQALIDAIHWVLESRTRARRDATPRGTPARAVTTIRKTEYENNNLYRSKPPPAGFGCQRVAGLHPGRRRCAGTQERQGAERKICRAEPPARFVSKPVPACRSLKPARRWP